MYLPRDIKGSDRVRMADPAITDDPVPSGMGFLIVIAISLVFWLALLGLIAAV